MAKKKGILQQVIQSNMLENISYKEHENYSQFLEFEKSQSSRSSSSIDLSVQIEQIEEQKIQENVEQNQKSNSINLDDEDDEEIQEGEGLSPIRRKCSNHSILSQQKKLYQPQRSKSPPESQKNQNEPEQIISDKIKKLNRNCSFQKNDKNSSQSSSSIQEQKMISSNSTNKSTQYIDQIKFEKKNQQKKFSKNTKKNKNKHDQYQYNQNVNQNSIKNFTIIEDLNDTNTKSNMDFIFNIQNTAKLQQHLQQQKSIQNNQLDNPNTNNLIGIQQNYNEEQKQNGHQTVSKNSKITLYKINNNNNEQKQAMPLKDNINLLIPKKQLKQTIQDSTNHRFNNYYYKNQSNNSSLQSSETFSPKKKGNRLYMNSNRKFSTISKDSPIKLEHKDRSKNFDEDKTSILSPENIIYESPQKKNYIQNYSKKKSQLFQSSDQTLAYQQIHEKSELKKTLQIEKINKKQHQDKRKFKVSTRQRISTVNSYAKNSNQNIQYVNDTILNQYYNKVQQDYNSVQHSNRALSVSYGSLHQYGDILENGIQYQ
ncbi:hypothetical protein PPERSA_11970 [Pseudocohnilembus persalinus]|uniref:Uncharacterized protein n=1 Tax=Pseudocohnilembus persalinus TaxID=266149 RepID=A0A0V0QK73_PSEPJ|nr:hypothetical protein PPERSA_11970 [Pseudocohnilembus persalinus]|eukprot:KRX02630.1 hypothetical protein PPERSA_11970 [Pseudocohnilembus persalinus]